jgi:LysM repeat protein
MRPRRSPARWLAPLALVAVIFAIYSVVNESLLSKDSAGTTSARQASTASGGKTAQRSQRRRRHRRTYRVKPGDTLSSIAVKTGVSLARIQQLNPKIDSQSLQTGQRVKLSP